MSALLQYGPLVLILVAFYFVLIRPQQKKQRDLNAMLKALKAGDNVVTIGGVHGTVTDLDDQTVILRVSENTRIKFDRSAVKSVR